MDPQTATRSRMRAMTGERAQRSWLVALGSIAGSGLLINVYLAVVARNVSAEEYGYFGAFWSLALMVGFGAFLPVEQELARLLQTPQRRLRVLRSAAMLSGIIAAAAVAAVALTAPVLDTALGDHNGLLLATAALCAVSAVQFLTRGLLVGLGHIGSQGAVTLLDSGLRVALALCVAAAGADSSVEYGWTLVVAIAVAHVPVLAALVGKLRREDAEQPDHPVTGSLAAPAAPLLLGSVCAQLLLNGIPVLVSGLAEHGERTAAGGFLAAFLLARIPLFAAVPLQTAVIPSLTRVGAQPGAMAALLGRLGAAWLAVTAVGTLGALVIGPDIVELVFGSDYRIDGHDGALMVAGVMAHLGLLFTTQALVATSMHREVAVSWVAGVVVAAVMMVSVQELIRAAELAFLTGSAVGFGIAVAHLLARSEGRRTGSA